MTDDPFKGASSDASAPPALTKEDVCPVAGKYYNQRIKDIPLSYLNWLVQQDWFAGKYPDMAEYVNSANPEDHIVRLTEDSPCPVRGKHHGKPMREVPASYLTWLLDQEWAESRYPEIVVYCTENDAALEQQEDEEARAWAQARRRADDA